MARLTYANVAATAACGLAAAALAVALSDGDREPAAASTEPAAPPAVVARAERADSAGRADRARDADRAAVASRARRADRATTARRLSGPESRRLAAAIRRSSAIAAPAPVALRVGQSRTLLAAGPFTFRASCARPRGRQSQVRVSVRSRDGGALLSVDGSAAVSLPARRDRVVLQIVSDKPLWFGGRSFSVSGPGGASMHGTISFGVNQLDRDCIASAAALT